MVTTRPPPGRSFLVCLFVSSFYCERMKRNQIDWISKPSRTVGDSSKFYAKPSKAKGFVIGSDISVIDYKRERKSRRQTNSQRCALSHHLTSIS
mmetsp:Transcript_20573/g.48814  ORF Transcript_20573/g.48814 Transcript_20573/m.48814 type:complete len:94 (+) Transcript_20573:35-316(+)